MHPGEPRRVERPSRDLHRPHRERRRRPCRPRSRRSLRWRGASGAARSSAPRRSKAICRSGVRRVHDRGRPGYQRALDMLLDKLHGRPFRSEVPYAAPERVTPAPPIADLSRARIAMVTTGGLVRKGNPDKQVSANAVRYHRHTVAELESLSPQEWEAYHAGLLQPHRQQQSRTTSCRCPSCVTSSGRARSARSTSTSTRCPA